MKDILILKENGIIIYITGNAIERTATGYFVDNTIFGDELGLDLVSNVEVPAGVKSHSHKFINGAFTENEKYVPPEKNPRELMAEIVGLSVENLALKTQLESTAQAVDFILMNFTPSI